MIWNTWQGNTCMQIKENSMWVKTSTQSMVCKNWWLRDELGITKSKADSNLYYKVEDDGIMILWLYVDYLFLKGKEKLINECKNNLETNFEMKDHGMMHYFLGLEVWQFLDEIFLNQGKYVVEILKRFGMLDCKEMNTLMVKNLNLLNDDSSERVDVTLYRQIISH